MLNDLLGRTIIILIGEPWDFTSEEGDNILKGRIVATSPGSDPEWLQCKVSPFMFNDQTVTSVIAVHRYSDETFRLLLKGESIGANLLYDPKGTNLAPSQIPSALNNKMKLEFLVGSIEINDANI